MVERTQVEYPLRSRLTGSIALPTTEGMTQMATRKDVTTTAEVDDDLPPPAQSQMTEEESDRALRDFCEVMDHHQWVEAVHAGLSKRGFKDWHLRHLHAQAVIAHATDVGYRKWRAMIKNVGYHNWRAMSGFDY
jgi:hypothetical protein